MHSQKLTMYTIKRIVADTLGSTRFHEGNIKRISWQVGSQSSHNNDEMKGNPSNASQWIMSVAIAIHIRSTATRVEIVQMTWYHILCASSSICPSVYGSGRKRPKHGRTQRQ